MPPLNRVIDKLSEIADDAPWRKLASVDASNQATTASIAAKAITADKLADAATQSVADGFTLQHNNREVLIVQNLIDSAFVTSSAVTAIAGGSHVGQQLLIIYTIPGGWSLTGITLKDAAGTDLIGGDWGRVYSPSSGGVSAGAWLLLCWTGSVWKKTATNDGLPVDVSGSNSHGEGNATTASGGNSHAEGNATTAIGGNSHAEGYATTASGLFSHAQGNESEATADNTHAGGKLALARLEGQLSHSGGDFGSTLGGCQWSRFQIRGATAAATQTELVVPERFTLEDETAYGCTITILGRRDTGGGHYLGKFACIIERTGGVVALAGAVQTLTEINPPTWGGVSITADDVNKSLAVKVTGAAASNIRWSALIETVDIKYND